MKITHYAVRELHDEDAYAPGTCDVIAKSDTGLYFYSEDLFDTHDAAAVYLAGLQLKPLPIECWQENDVAQSAVECVVNLKWEAA